MDVLEEPEEEGVLTAERVLRHAQAQGLQPVVDVRFSHRHLELCREKGTGDLGQGTWQGPCLPAPRPLPAPLLPEWGARGVGNHPKGAPRGSGHVAGLWQHFVSRCNHLRQETFAK